MPLTGGSETIKSVYQLAVEKWGASAQLDMLHEEIGELMVAINHYRRDNREGTREAIIEEIADVEIMLGQLTFMIDAGEDVMLCKMEKMKRLKSKLREEAK